MYWGVSLVDYRGSRQWLAQHRGFKLWKIGFPDKDSAARWLARKLGATVSSLRKRSRLHSLNTSMYKGVLPRLRSADGTISWQAQSGGEYLGSFRTEKLVARAVAKRLQVSLAGLLKKASGSRGAKSGVKRKISARRARILFKAAYPVFKKYVAADYASLTAMEDKFARAFRKDSHM